ncbi:PucR family transcriptional regulator [Ureibacillus chungkukjangi]|uniref:Purine catabolism regulator n=1 Tax=Ureibacillus chungkukjangi TaxID=1202712 RepID=A0A318TJD1_9BACL|nr:PucR family transcriptional regulator [Ureibacillus chungkukjangi]PYF03957.1 purine catabolism regulator [Ureibacillus chungkukjangi]
MQYTLQDVLTIPLLSSAKLLSGEERIATQVVDSVSVMELPVEDFVRNNELVLTTAIGCGNNTEVFVSYVKEVFLSGASALAVAIGRHVHYIPQEVIDFCNINNFPIIELPWEIRFSDIIKIILEQLNNWEQTSTIKADDIQRELLKLYLDNESIDTVLRYLSKDFQMDVTLTYNDVFEICERHDQKESFILKKEEPSIVHLNSGMFMQIIPIHLLNQQYCFILFKSKKLNASPLSWLVLNQIVTILTLWIQKERTFYQNKEKEINDYIKLLLNGNWSEKEEFIKQGHKIGIDVEVPYVCVVGIPEKVEEFYHLYKKDKSKESEKDFIRAFSELVETSAKKINKKVIYTFQKDLLIVFLECKVQDASQDVNCLLNLLDEHVKENRIPSISWGIGENHAGSLTFHLSYKNARTALEIGRSQKGAGSRSTFASTGIYQLLISLTNNTFSTELMHDTIGVIAAYDKNNGLDLLHTLSSYIIHQGNVSQTARALNLHRQSLLYRLRKIESLTNRSLNDPDDIFLLQFCLKLWTVRFEKKETSNII